MSSRTYKLEQLYEDQDPALAMEAIPHLISWVDPNGDHGHGSFQLREVTPVGAVDYSLRITWDIALLSTRDAQLPVHLERFRSGKTLTGEHRTEYAAYGLAMVAISCFLGKRVLRMNRWRAPDLLLDATPGRIRGVEVAGRTRYGHSAFAQAIDGDAGKTGKRAQLIARQDVIEAYLSLWCIDPTVAHWEKVKP
ncbi:hypothetical protein [Polyangium sorediatum]|uniref:Uncharacterized protein n=1 Tax=Polyangium sorediatum TaxID=889274 RepID=A0ABT6NRV9_9BACT|nr:hypothetical protein [Polyangium sorediatum]MDI1431049.1 hypothetical protein [Polyangium sorediatum]